MNTKYFYTILSLGLVSILVGCGDKKPAANLPNGQAITVKVETIGSETENNVLTVSGTVEAANAANLSTRVMGFVDQIHVNVGDKVRQGQLLISINSNDLKAKSAQVKANITEAEAALQVAQKDYERFKTLFEQNSASQKELDDMTARYTMAKARMQAIMEMQNEIDAQFAYTNIKAPFNGVIASKFIDIGGLANPGIPLISIETSNSFEVTARIPEQRITDIKSGMQANIYLSSIDARFTGTVTEVSSSSAMSGGQYLATVRLQNPTEFVRSGMFATLQFPTVKGDKSGSPDVILIPKTALIERGQLTGIYTVSQQNTAILRWLRLGKTLGDHVEVLSGLSGGERYISSSNEKLYNGAKLSIQ